MGIEPMMPVFEPVTHTLHFSATLIGIGFLLEMELLFF
jgi:hypothetical protein